MTIFLCLWLFCKTELWYNWFDFVCNINNIGDYYEKICCFIFVGSIIDA